MFGEIRVVGDGAVACGPGVVAAGKGGIAIGRMVAAELNRAFPYESVVCVKRGNSVVGLGVMVSDTHIITTCDILSGEQGQTKVAFFPFLSAKEIPITPVVSVPHANLSLARLNSPPPQDAIAATFLSELFQRHSVRVWGYIPDGQWIWFLGRGRTGEENVMLELISDTPSSSSAILVGGPVWDRDARGIIGIVSGRLSTDRYVAVRADSVLHLVSNVRR